MAALTASAASTCGAPSSFFWASPSKKGSTTSTAQNQKVPLISMPMVLGPVFLLLSRLFAGSCVPVRVSVRLEMTLGSKLQKPLFENARLEANLSQILSILPFGAFEPHLSDLR